MSQIPVSEEDLDGFFVDGEFAQTVSLPGGDISAIITDAYDTLSGGTVGIEGAEVMLICKTVDVDGIEHGAFVSVGTEDFIVVNVQPDNSGITRLQIQRAD